MRATVYHPVLKGQLIFEGISLGSGQRGVPSIWLFRPDIDKRPVRLPMSGQVSDLAKLWACTVDPQHNEILLLAGDGIFRISVEPS